MFDLFFSKYNESVSSDDIHRLSVVFLLIADKLNIVFKNYFLIIRNRFENDSHISAIELIYLLPKQQHFPSVKQIIDWEVIVLRTLNYDICVPTVCPFVRHYCSTSGGYDFNSAKQAYELLKVCALHRRSSGWKPSLLAAAAVKCVFDKNGIEWEILHFPKAWNRCIFASLLF